MLETSHTAQTLYSRYEDGSVPVHISKALPKPYYEVSGRIYKSARQLLIGLTGHPAGRHWTFDRYFRLGKYVTKWHHENVESPIVALFEVIPSLETLTIEASTVPATPYSVTITQTPKGIDLAKRGKEVAKLLFAGFGQKIYSAGYDPDDVLQEVYKGLLIRNAGTCPWDASKSSFGHYVHMVCGCILSNYHRKTGRTRSMEQTGVLGAGEDGLTMMDVADGRALIGVSAKQSHDAALVNDLASHLKSQPLCAERAVALRILPLVAKGFERGDIATQMGLSKGTVTRALTFIRKNSSSWISG